MPILSFRFPTLAAIANYINQVDVTVLSVDAELCLLKVKRCRIAEKVALTQYQASLVCFGEQPISGMEPANAIAICNHHSRNPLTCFLASKALDSKDNADEEYSKKLFSYVY